MLRVIHEDRSKGPGSREVGEPAAFGDGFHGEELDGSEAFRWTGREARLSFAPASVAGRTASEGEDRFLELEVFSPFFDCSQRLTVEAEGSETPVELVHGWAPVSVPVPPSATGATLRVSKLLPEALHRGDLRDLGVRIRRPKVHGDAARHAAVSRQHVNAVLNLREMLEGRAELRSTPPVLGMDLHGVCNVKPPCVYCGWDEAKALEGDAVDTPFTLRTLEEWGDFFDNSATLVNCSIGEPFMMGNTLDALLDAFGAGGKTLELVTNGQILTDRNIGKLLGRKVHLYISLDAATTETYAKLRNDKFDRILGNLRRLIAAKGGPSGLPKVHLVFMPMRVNLHELEGFVRLCAELGVDRMVLRPLNYTEEPRVDWVRGGYRFRYADELLPWRELVRVSGRAAALAERYRVPLSDQLGFGGDLADRFPEEFARGRREVAGSDPMPPGGGDGGGDTGEPQPPLAPADEPLPSLGEDRLPPCVEPWTSLYILRRGVRPCSYGADPLAPMEDYRKAWSSPTLQALRADLAAGRLHAYCLKSETCPIVRKMIHQRPVRRAGRAARAAKAVWRRFDRLGRGVPGRLLHPLKRPLGGLFGRLGL